MSDAIRNALAELGFSATVGELNEDIGGNACEDWLSEVLGRPITLNQDSGFVPAATNLLTGHLVCCTENWEPNDEGYDDGPDPNDIAANWHRTEPCSTGQFRGTILSTTKPCDLLTAILLSDRPEDEIGYDDWEEPQTQEQRDADIADQIRVLVAKLSPEARAKLVIG